MIVGLGADIVENSRIAHMLERHGQRFLERIYTPEEIEYSVSHEDPVPYLSARFAVKEAAIKALNLPGGAGLSWRDVETAGRIFGKKRLALHGRAAAAAQTLGANRTHLTLTHSREWSMAVVILEQIQDGAK
ncbi:MAG: holo-ACP synthase [Leptospirales bacterium]|nr:holo-ACP synthase [Leptospirales bacterium]